MDGPNKINYNLNWSEGFLVPMTSVGIHPGEASQVAPGYRTALGAHLDSKSSQLTVTTSSGSQGGFPVYQGVLAECRALPGVRTS